MEYLKHFGNAGEYYPAFFEMKLKIDGMIDLNTCSDMDFALFSMNIFILYKILPRHMV